MKHIAAACPGLTRAAARGLAAGWLVLAAAAPACADGRLKAQYRISMTGVTIGSVAWSVDIRPRAYATTASGEAGGIFAILFSGKGEATTVGTVADRQLSPSHFTFRMHDDEGQAEVLVIFKDGVAREESTRKEAPEPDRVPITEGDRRNVLDPLTAVLLRVAPGGAMTPANCDRVLRIFDGYRRYDLSLSFIRVDRMTLARGYSGPALVCQVILQPVSGYRPDSKLVKYVAGRRDMELWFAPIDGAGVLAPLRVAMPTLLGTLKIEAESFEPEPATQRTPGPPRGAAPR